MLCCLCVFAACHKCVYNSACLLLIECMHVVACMFNMYFLDVCCSVRVGVCIFVVHVSMGLRVDTCILVNMCESVWLVLLCECLFAGIGTYTFNGFLCLQMF